MYYILTNTRTQFYCRVSAMNGLLRRFPVIQTNKNLTSKKLKPVIRCSSGRSHHSIWAAHELLAMFIPTFSLLNSHIWFFRKCQCFQIQFGWERSTALVPSVSVHTWWNISVKLASFSLLHCWSFEKGSANDCMEALKIIYTLFGLKP